MPGMKEVVGGDPILDARDLDSSLGIALLVDRAYELEVLLRHRLCSISIWRTQVAAAVTGPAAS